MIRIPVLSYDLANYTSTVFLVRLKKSLTFHVNVQFTKILTNVIITILLTKMQLKISLEHLCWRVFTWVLEVFNKNLHYRGRPINNRLFGYANIILFLSKIEIFVLTLKLLFY